MSCGVVLWPDQTTSAAVRAIWDELREAGLPSLASYTHQAHEPHCSLTVGDSVAIDQALEAIGHVPSRPIPLLAESVLLFPGGVLCLGVVVNTQLAAEQRRVHAAAAPFITDAWRYFLPDRWTPHLTLAMDLRKRQLAEAVSIASGHLPIEGTLDRGGVEDGSTAERWPALGAADTD